MRAKCLAVWALGLLLLQPSGGAYWDGPALAAAPGGAPGDQPRNVELVGQIGGACLAVAVQGRYAYIGVGPRLVVLDVSNPAGPLLLGRTAVLPGLVHGVAVAGTLAYVADGEAGLRVVDVSNPASPPAGGLRYPGGCQ
jgi:hypothetical protein